MFQPLISFFKSHGSVTYTHPGLYFMSHWYLNEHASTKIQRDIQSRKEMESMSKLEVNQLPQ